MLLGVVAIDCHALVHAFPNLRIRQDSTIQKSSTQAMASTRLCVRLLSGATVYKGLRHHSLAELRDEVAATLGCQCDELSFCSGDTVLSCIEDADEQITVVRDEVMGLLDEFVKCSLFSKLPEHLWPAREHRRLMLAAVAHNGDALQHASAELRADRDIILAAVTNNAYALRYASPELRSDRAVVMAALARNGQALQHASPELRADRDVVMAALARNGQALQHASPELRADRDVVMAALARNGHALHHVSPELRANRDVVMAAVESKGYALGFWPATKLQTSRQPDVHLNVGATITVAL